MSREIKFRAWDKEEKRIWWNVQNAYDTLANHHTPDPDFDDEKSEDIFYPSSFGEVIDNPEQYILMQYTGLKDKHGKEIYEGDIVKYGAAVGPIIWSPVHPEFVIDRNQAGSIGYLELSQMPKAKKYEVIGNIYENPDLLEQS